MTPRVNQFLVLIYSLMSLTALAAEVIPPAPQKFFNDYAGVVSAPAAAALNQRLEQFERDTSSQIVVAIFPRMQSDSSIEDYTVRVAKAWQVGLKDKNNGAVLFVFTQDRKLFLTTGYGLEGALPDALCKRIIEDEIKPHFKAGHFDAGLTAGVNAILAAAKGEYKGSGQTHRRHSDDSRSDPGMILFLILFGGVFVFIVFIQSKVRGHGGTWHGWTISSGGGGSWGGGGGSSGGFSGGGGSFGGGGAGGSW